MPRYSHIARDLRRRSARSQWQSWLGAIVIPLIIVILGLGLAAWIVIHFVRFLLAIWGWLLVGGMVALGVWLYLRQRRYQRSCQINNAFYKLIQDQRGRVTSLDLAMATNLPGQAATEYLKTQAKAFSAQFEVTEAGDVIYCFAIAQGYTAPHHPSEFPMTHNDTQAQNECSNRGSQTPLSLESKSFIDLTNGGVGGL